MLLELKDTRKISVVPVTIDSEKSSLDDSLRKLAALSS